MGTAPSNYVPANITWSTTDCTVIYSPCDPFTHSVNIKCVENSIGFNEKTAIRSILNIPDYIIPNGLPIIDINVSTEFSHTAVVDLEAGIQHENITAILFGDDHTGNTASGCSEKDDVNVLISDQSVNVPWYDGEICDIGSYGIGGSHRPVTPLSVYNDIDANGDWYFIIVDQDINDAGIFGSWSITLTLPPTYCVPISNSQYFISSITGTYDQLKQHCVDRGMVLASFRTIENLDYLANLCDLAGGSYCWLGFDDVDFDHRFTFVDGTPFHGLDAFGVGEPHNTASSHSCGCIAASTSNATIYDASCGTTWRGICLQTQTVPTTTTWDTSIDDKYAMSSISGSYEEVKQDCIDQGMVLASFETVSDVRSLYNLCNLNAGAIGYCYIGLDDTDFDYQFTFVDGTTFNDLNSWADGRPQNLAGYECGCIKGISPVVKSQPLYNCACSGFEVYGICLQPPTTTTTPWPTSIDDKYVMSSITGSYEEVKQDCVDQGMVLASFETISDYQSIYNLCKLNHGVQHVCYIGLDDTDFDHQYRFVDDTSFNDLNRWGDGEPKNSLADWSCGCINVNDGIIKSKSLYDCGCGDYTMYGICLQSTPTTTAISTSSTSTQTTTTTLTNSAVDFIGFRNANSTQIWYLSFVIINGDIDGCDTIQDVQIWYRDQWTSPGQTNDESYGVRLAWDQVANAPFQLPITVRLQTANHFDDDYFRFDDIITNYDDDATFYTTKTLCDDAQISTTSTATTELTSSTLSSSTTSTTSTTESTSSTSSTTSSTSSSTSSTSSKAQGRLSSTTTTKTVEIKYWVIIIANAMDKIETHQVTDIVFTILSENDVNVHIDSERKSNSSIIISYTTLIHNDNEYDTEGLEEKLEITLETEYDKEFTVTITTEMPSTTNYNQADNQDPYRDFHSYFENITLSIAILFVILMISAYIDAWYCRINDFFRISAIATAAVHILDMISDVFFSIKVSFHPDYIASFSSPLFVILFISALCILISVFVSLYQLHRQINKKWINNDHLRLWVANNITLLYGLSIMSGSAFAAVNLAYSNAFSLPQFDMPLTRIDFLEFQTQRIYSTILMENIPQLALQIGYVFISGSDRDSFVFISMALSLVSIVVAILSMCTQKTILYGNDFINIQIDVIGSMVTNNQKRCKNSVLSLRTQLSSVFGVEKELIEITRPTVIVNGLRLNINLFINNTMAIDKNCNKLLNQARNSGKLAELIKLSWNLDGIPTISNIKYEQKQSQKRMDNTVMIQAMSFSTSSWNSGYSHNSHKGSINMNYSTVNNLSPVITPRSAVPQMMQPKSTMSEISMPPIIPPVVVTDFGGDGNKPDDNEESIELESHRITVGGEEPNNDDEDSVEIIRNVTLGGGESNDNNLAPGGGEHDGDDTDVLNEIDTKY